MSDIKINDIFEELIDENKKLNECLNVLIKFKTFIDLVSDKLKTNLDSNVFQLFDDIHQEVEDVFRRNEIKFSVNKSIKSREQIIDSLDIKPKFNGNNQRISSESKDNGLELKLLSKKKTYKRLSNGTKARKEYILDENQRYICTFVGCGQRLKSKDSLRSHLKLHSGNAKPFRCDFDGCGFSTGIRKELIDHINAHKGIKPYECQYCSNRFTAERYLKSHIKFRHKLLDQILICEFNNCNKQFKTELSFKNHQKFHIMEKSFVCDEPNCPFKTINASLLRQHKKRVHSNERPFVCNIVGCNKAYKVRDELHKHFLSHSSERNFKCLFDGCNKTFKTSNSLRKHSELHSDIEYKCDWPGCDYTSKSSICLQSHQRVHNTDRNYPCNWPECCKRFRSKKDLDVHLRIHNNDKRYACHWPGCLYRCCDYGNLLKHRRIHTK